MKPDTIFSSEHIPALKNAIDEYTKLAEYINQAKISHDPKMIIERYYYLEGYIQALTERENAKNAQH
jgi:hypothetical protein